MFHVAFSSEGSFFGMTVSSFEVHKFGTDEFNEQIKDDNRTYNENYFILFVNGQYFILNKLLNYIHISADSEVIL